MTMQVAIIGGSGFVGDALTHALPTKDDNVPILSRSTAPRQLIHSRRFLYGYYSIKRRFRYLIIYGGGLVFLQKVGTFGGRPVFATKQ